MKMVLAYIFLFIFSFQVLPVKEIGKLLYKGMMTEEIHESGADNDDTGCDLKKQNDPFVPYKQDSYNNSLLILTCNGLGTSSPEHVSKQFIPEILTPPPNLG